MRFLVFFTVSIVLFCGAVSALHADPPAVIASGQRIALWENNSSHVRFLARNNLEHDLSVPYELSGPGLFESGTVLLEARDQCSLGFSASSLGLGIHDFVLTLWDSIAEPDTVFCTASATVAVIDSLTKPETHIEFEPDVVLGHDPYTYKPIDKTTIVKIPKDHTFAGHSNPVSWFWHAEIQNPSTGNGGGVFVAIPDEGEITVVPGVVYAFSVSIDATDPVPFGSLNDLHIVITLPEGDTLVNVSTPIVADSTDHFPTDPFTGVHEPTFEPSTWSRVKSLFR